MAEPESASPPRSRFRRALGAIGKAIGVTALFTAAIAGSALLHLDMDLAAVRREVARQANMALPELFEDKLIVGEIEHLTLTRLDIATVRVEDDDQAEIVRARGVHARFDVLAIAKGALYGYGVQETILESATIEHADVVMPGVQRAFIPRARKDTTPTSPPSRPQRFLLKRIAVESAWVHGYANERAPLDTDVFGLTGSLVIDSNVEHRIVGEPVSQATLQLDLWPFTIVERQAAPGVLIGSTDYHLRIDTHRGTLAMWVGTDGSLDGEALSFAAFTKLDLGAKGQPLPLLWAPTPVLALHAYVDVARVTPWQLQSVEPRIKLEKAASLEAALGWENKGVEATLHASLDQGGTVDVSLRPDGPARVEGHINARALDVHALGVAQVNRPVTLDTHFDLILPKPGTPIYKADGIADIHTDPTAIEGQPVPELDIHLAKSGPVIHALITAHELGAPVTASLTWGHDEVLQFQTDADVPSLAALPRLSALGVKGIDLSTRDLRVKGSITPAKGEGLKGLAKGALDVSLQGSVASLLTSDGVALNNATLRSHIHGPLDRPKDLTVEASVQGKGFSAGGEHADKVALSAQGRLLAPHFEAKLNKDNGDDIALSGDVNLDERRAKGLKLSVKRRGVELKGDVDKVSFGRGGIALDGLRLAGDGVAKVGGGLVIQNGELIGKLRGEGIDLSQLAKLAGNRMPPLVGLADIDVNLQRAPKGRRGHIALHVEGATHKGFDHSLSTSVTATFDGDKVTLDAGTRLMAKAKANDKDPIQERCAGAIAGLRISNARGTIQGPLLSSRLLDGLDGKAEIAADDLDLRCLQRFVTSLDVLPRSLLPKGVRDGLAALTSVEVTGKLNLSALVNHPRGATLPSIERFEAKTRGLTAKGPTPQGKDEPAWVSNDLDVALEGSADVGTGKIKVKATLLDQAPIGSLSVETALDLATPLKDRNLGSEIRRAPITAHLSLPKRPIAWLDAIPGLSAVAPRVAGSLGVEGRLQGTLEEPVLTLRVLGNNVAETVPRAERQPGEQATWSLPMDVDAMATYNGHHAALDILVRHAGKQVARATGGVDLDASALWSGQKPSIKGGVRATFDGVPLGDIPYFADRGVTGNLRGALSIAGLGGRPSVHAAFDAGGLKLGEDFLLDRGLLKLDVDPPDKDGRARVVSRVDLQGSDGGTIDVRGDLGVRWINGLTPSLDDKQPIDMALNASKFHIAAAHPFLSDTLSRLDGLLDGKAEIKMSSLDGKPSIAATMKIKNGVFNVPAIGQEFTGGTLTLEAKGGTITVRDVGASGTKGRFKASADATFDGLDFKGAKLTLEIPERDEIPITLQGAPLGDAFGKITIDAVRDEKLIKVTVGVPKLTLVLPKAIARATQGLDDNPEVRLAKSRKRPVERIRPSGKVAVSFDIGSILVKSGSFGEVEITGDKTSPPRLEVIDGEAKVSGDLKVVRGKIKIEILKRTFEIEKGLVHLRPEEIANPFVNVTARWDTPDKQSIFIDYVGVILPVTEQKLKLRSPTIPERDIYATLLLGSVQQSTFDSKSLAGTGQQLGGALLASQLNVQLSNNFSTSFSTNQDGSIRPGITYNSGDKTIELSTYENAGQANAAAGDTASRGQHTQITIDWRFYNRWSLRGYVDMGSSGQTNSGLDVLWLYRY